jgi:tetratricopeptide (TPR) repeat protein
MATLFRSLIVSAFLATVAGCYTIPTPPVANNSTPPDKKQAKPESPNPKPTHAPKPDHFETGHQLAKDGLYREAIREYQRARQQDENRHEIDRSLGMIYVKIGQYQKAIEHLEKAHKEFPQDFSTNYYLAEAYRTEDRYDDAIFHYKTALYQKPEHTQTLKALAWSYFQIRYYRAAYESAKKLREMAPRDIQADIIMARILNQMGRTEPALAIIRKALVLSKKGELPYLRSVLGDILETSGDCQKASEVYREALKDQPLLAGALLGLGKCMVQSSKDIDKAREFIKRALRLKPKLYEAYYWLAKSYENKDSRRAARYYMAFKKRAASDPSLREEVEVARQRISSFTSSQNDISSTKKKL